VASASGDDSETARLQRVRELNARDWEVRAVRAEGEIRLDGRLDEADWGRAEQISDFYQRERNEGVPATERTEVRVLYDRTQLFVGFRCFDSEPGRHRARGIFRDERPPGDDLVAILLDPFHDHRSAVQLVSNSNELVLDLLQTGEAYDTRNVNWDTVWDSRGSRSSRGWEVEVAIPFKSLRFGRALDGEEQVFGIGFKRNIPRKNEEVYWPFVRNDSTWYRPAELGHLKGLAEVEPGRNLEIRPYALAAGQEQADTPGTERRWELGGDLKWGVTPGLTADFTINTDFAQEESDIQQLNFTRFSLFFPEKRQFFLEGQRMFQFGVPEEADLVFTRRIGLSSDGEVVPLIAGARLSGRLGRTGIGFMNIQSEAHAGVESENFTVLRLRRDVFRRSSVGLLLTNRQGGGWFNRVLGADVSFPKGDWLLEGFVAAVDTPEESRDSGAGYGRLAYATDRLGGSYRFLYIGEEFDPGIGFVRRPGSRESSGSVRFSPRTRSPWIRQLHFEGRLVHIEDQDNVLETRERELSLSGDFESGDVVTLRVTNRLENLVELFELREDAIVAPGSYNFNTFEANLTTYRRRHQQIILTYQTGGFWDGHRQRLSADATYRVSPKLGLTTGYEVNWIDVGDTAFTSQLVSGRIQVALRKSLVLLSLFQYNSDSRSLSTNIRLNWIPKPGSDLFIVYNETGELEGPHEKNRSLSIKLNYLFAL